MVRSCSARLVLPATALALLAAAFPFAARGQSILTVAGGGTDDGQLATDISLRYPMGVSYSPDGTLFVSEGDGRVVRRIDGTTRRSRIIGGSGLIGFSGDGGPAREARFSSPSAVLLQGSSLLGGDGNERIRRIDLQTGLVTTWAGGGTSLGDGGPATRASLNGNGGLAQDSAGNVYLADRYQRRVRRIDAATGIITTFAGTGEAGDSGDGGPATEARLRHPIDVAVDTSGNVFVADYEALKVRRIDSRSGIISTVAGDGSDAVREGALATASGLWYPISVAVGPSGDLWIGDNQALRRVPASTGRLATVRPGHFWDIQMHPDGRVFLVDSADMTVSLFDPGSATSTVLVGGGTLGIGDGGPATAALLVGPVDVAAAPDGSVLLTEGLRVRRFRAGGLLTTVAGNGRDDPANFPWSGDVPATAASFAPYAIAVDESGDFFVSDSRFHVVFRVSARTGILSRFAGGGSQDPGNGGPAREAYLLGPYGLCMDRRGGLVVAELGRHRVRRVDLATGIITTLAGTGIAGFAGDGGPALNAQLKEPRGVAADAAGNIYVGDTGNFRVRRIDAGTGRIDTIVGGGSTPVLFSRGAPIPARSAALSSGDHLASDSVGNLILSGGADGLVRYDRSTDTVNRMIASAGGNSSGDGGRLAEASVAGPGGVALGASDDLFVVETASNRIRGVFKCVAVSATSLATPADGASGTSTGPTLSWMGVAGAFRYDVYLGTANPPTAGVATDLEATSFTPLNLSPSTRYFWRVVAKGDPFCVPPSTAASPVRSFTTEGGCTPPAALVLSAPAEGATVAASAVTLSWAPSSGAGTYDVYFGPGSPPPLAAPGIASTSYTPSGLAPGGLYYWSILAHAACDPAKTASSVVRSFQVAGVGCVPPGAFSLSVPADGASGVEPDVALSWTASPNATSYDFHVGLSSPPPLHLSGLTSTALALRGLSAGATYRWKVVARTSCGTATAETAVRSFTVRGTCATPGTTSFTFLPPGAVGTGQTYVVAWSAASGLDTGGGFAVERSMSPAFSPLLDSITTTASFAGFVAPASGSLYHRVRAIPVCDPSKAGPWSSTGVVSVVSAKPNVVFSRAPDAVIVGLGDVLELKRTTFSLENVTSSPLQVIVSRQELQSVPFFTIADPSGGDAAFVTLEPRVPKLLEVHYSGPPTDAPGAYQGLIVVSSTGAGLAVTPYAFVSLKVGSSPDAVPELRVNGTVTEYAAFPGVGGSDLGRPPITVDVRPPGPSPLELAAEVGPEVWLSLEPGWNSTPIPPGGTRTLRLSTSRTRAPNGSALPRYTYLTLRTKGGKTSRLLVQDNDAPLLSAGRGASAVRPEASFLVPSVAHVTSALGNTFVSRLSLSNAGTEPVQAELVFTPASSDSKLVDGFDDAATRRATVVVPPNDLVRLSDPLILLFGLTPPVAGTLEVRAPSARAGFLSVSSSVDAPSSAGGTFGFALPVFRSGEGLRAGSLAAITAVASDAAERTNLILAETTGVDSAVAKVSLYDRNGALVGSESVTVPRWGQRQLSGVVSRLGGGFDSRAGRLELSVESGGGTIAAVTTVVDNFNDDAAAFAARALDSSVAAARTLRPVWARATNTVKSLVPSVVNGYQTFPASAAPFTFRSVMGFTSLSSGEALFRLTYYDLTSGASLYREVRAPGRKTVEYTNALEQLFGIGAGVKSQGPLFVESDPNGLLWCRVASSLAQGTIGDSFPVIPIPSEGLTAVSSARVLSLDGLEQSVDRSRGTRSNLLLNEVAGKPLSVIVSLYEAGNRSSPIAERELSLGPLQKVQLSTVFAELGLDSEARRKDRTNVLCTVRAVSGEGLASAVVTTIDNRTGDTRNVSMVPSSSGAAGVSIGF